MITNEELIKLAAKTEVAVGLVSEIQALRKKKAALKGDVEIEIRTIGGVTIEAIGAVGDIDRIVRARTKEINSEIQVAAHKLAALFR